MSKPEAFSVILFNSVSHAMMAEKLLKTSGMEHKLIPVPRHISSDCGVCIRIRTSEEEAARSTLSDRVEISGIQSL